jgi:iron complex transport system substrate-binding protein
MKGSGVIIALLVGISFQPAVASEAPASIVSLDYCADQYVIALADPQRVVALSQESRSEYSYFAEEAADYSMLRPTSEEVLMTGAEIVVRQWGGGFNAPSHLARFGVATAQVAFGDDIESTRKNLRTMGSAFDATEKANALIADMNARLDRVAKNLPPEEEKIRAMYVTPSGFTTGEGTFVHAVLEAAGVQNLSAEGARRGWFSLNLEVIALDPPDMIIAAFFDLRSQRVSHWSIARHSFVQKTLETTPVVWIPSAVVACSAWFVVDAVEAINEAARELKTMRAPPS